MPETVRTCPNCGGNLAATRFARQVTCAFCGSVVQLDASAVQAARYRDAWAKWADPEAAGFRDVTWIGGRPWALGPCFARGEAGDAHIAVRARIPTETVIVRLGRAPADGARITRAWEALQALQASSANGAHVFVRRLPEPVARGVVEAGAWKGRPAIVTRWAHGYPTTLAGLPPLDAAASVWVWRRVLEALAFVHASGLVHGAVTPAHVLVEAGEHGARLVGFGNAGAPGTPIGGIDPRYRALYPDTLQREGLSVRDDLRMSARALAAAMGGNPTTGEVAAPEPYAAVLHAVATFGRTPQGDGDAWSIRERLDAVGRAAFGAPRFRPLVPKG